MNDHTSAGRQDELLRRMRASDPAQTASGGESWGPDLAEAAMSTTPAASTTRTRRWTPALAAAAALTVIGGITYAALDEGDQPGDAPRPTVTTLAMPDGRTPSMTSCIPFEVRLLRDMPVAFSGTATTVGGSSITLDVDRWYKGGSADVVELANYEPGTVSSDGFEFTQGDRYLITASGGTVNFCGFSGRWSQRLADAFAEAFGPLSRGT